MYSVALPQVNDKFRLLIPAEARLPARRTVVFTTCADDQAEVGLLPAQQTAQQTAQRTAQLMQQLG
jgi:hypothetical protein